MKRAFTILEAPIGALMLSCLIAVFADYFVSRTNKSEGLRDADGFVSSGHWYGNANQVVTGRSRDLVISQHWSNSKISLIK